MTAEVDFRKIAAIGDVVYIFGHSYEKLFDLNYI